MDIHPIMLYHVDKRHGINEDILKQIDNGSLVITPDASVNTLSMAVTLGMRNIKVISLDHHDILIEHPNVITINNQYDDVTNRTLSGAGVTHKFVQWLYEYMGVDANDKYYDLVALSIISDSCSVKHIENRAYIYHTFSKNKISNPFLRYLCENLIKGNITPHELSFKVINILNSVCRFNNQKLKDKVFRCFVGENTNYDEVLAECKNIKKTQDDKVNGVLDSTEIMETKNLNIMFTENANDISGLLANKIMSKYSKPSFVVHKKGEEYIGSCRSPVPIRDLLEESGLFSICQGHSMAHGVGFSIYNLLDIIDYCNGLDINNLEEEYVIDKISENHLPLSYCYLCEDYQDLWCSDLPRPYVYLEITCKGTDWKSLRGATIKYEGKKFNLLKFFVSNQQKENWHINSNKTYIYEIIGEPSINEWNGKFYPQIIIEKMNVKEINCFD